MYREEQLKALLQGRRILIAGYGREGKSAENLIKRLLPDAPVTIATQVENGKWKADGVVFGVCGSCECLEAHYSW
jgi:hypothetical protein